MISRREFFGAGGLALAGLALAPGEVVRWAFSRGEVIIRMRSDATGARVWFDPVGALVRPGQTVRWVLQESVHSTTAYHPQNGGHAQRIPVGAAPWDSGVLVEPGTTFTIALTEEGIYDYFCIPHEAAGMVGRLVVLREGGVVPPTSVLSDRGPRGMRVPPSALRAFPDAAQIVRRGVIRSGG